MIEEFPDAKILYMGARPAPSSEERPYKASILNLADVEVVRAEYRADGVEVLPSSNPEDDPYLPPSA